MSQPSDQKPIVRRAAFRLAPAICRHFLQALVYVETRHHHIDPDMFDIDLDVLTQLRPRFEPVAPPQTVRVSFTYDDLFALETIVMAADVYSHRHGESPVPGVTDDDLAAMQSWITSARRWFITPLKEPL